jgi:hypothetical protein
LPANAGKLFFGNFAKFEKCQKINLLSFRQNRLFRNSKKCLISARHAGLDPASSHCDRYWTPAFAGVTDCEQGETGGSGEPWAKFLMIGCWHLLVLRSL